MKSKTDTKNIMIAILAAGESKRFNSCKQVTLIEGKPMITWVAEAVQQLNCNVYVVTGAYEKEVIKALQGFQLEFLHNSDYKQGISSSIKLAVNQSIARNQHLLLTFSDLPYVTEADYMKLIDAFSEEQSVFSTFLGTIGPPVLFCKNDLPKLMSLSGDQGAKKILSNYLTVSIENAAKDIDERRDIGP